MSSVARSDNRMTAAQYLEWDRQQTVRHEFYDGEVFAQAGGTRQHSLISTNTARVIGVELTGHEREAHGSDMRIHIEATGYYAYPDVSVVCPSVEGESEDVISNPVLLVEVLSPSTADSDRGGKFGHYRQIPSLKEYLVVWQDEPRVEQHQKTADGLWLLREVVGIDQMLNLISIDRAVPLSESYAMVSIVTLPPGESRGTSGEGMGLLLGKTAAFRQAVSSLRLDCPGGRVIHHGRLRATRESWKTRPAAGRAVTRSSLPGLPSRSVHSSRRRILRRCVRTYRHPATATPWAQFHPAGPYPCR